MGETQTRYHVSLDVADRAGVLAQVATAFADHGVSIESVRQQMHGEDDADLVIVTHRASDAALSATVEALRRRSTIVRDVRSRDAGGGRRRAWTPSEPWRGVIAEYGDRLPVGPGTPVVSLGEGGTPAGAAPSTCPS